MLLWTFDVLIPQTLVAMMMMVVVVVVLGAAGEAMPCVNALMIA